MHLFELIIGLLMVGALFTLWSGRLGVPYPALLALAGAVIALLPALPVVGFDPELALPLFVAPAMLDAAYKTSPRDLRENLVPIIGLAVILVSLTVVAVAVAARLIVPDLGWAAAIALGAIVAPTDTSAATPILRKLRPPHRLLVILEGESMLNDASALLIYRVAVGAAMTGAFSAFNLLPTLLLSCGGGVLVGWLLARIQAWITLRVHDIAVNVLLQFVATFAVWSVAEPLGLSAVVTMITFAMTLARRVAGRLDARHRIVSNVVWGVAVLVLNVLAFILTGLQLEGVFSRLHGHRNELHTYLLCAGAVCATVLLVRTAWVMAYSASIRWKRSRVRSGAPVAQPGYGNGILASWCGMRGILTLAAALALPDGASAFPHRDLIVFSAFCVVMFTVIFQGLTLRLLMQWLGLHDEGSVEREIAIARVETARAALRALEAEDGVASPADILRNEYRTRIQAGESGNKGEANDGAGLPALQKKAVMVQREALRDLRVRKVIGEDAFHAVADEIDLLELAAETRVGPAN